MTLQQVRDHLSLPPTSTHDAKLSDLIKAAESFISNRTNRALSTSKYRLTLDALPLTTLVAIQVPKCPVQTVDQFTYLDSDGVRQTWDSADYELHNQYEPARILPVQGQSWPAAARRSDSVQIDFTAGYTKLPPEVQQVTLALVDHWWENRGTVGTGSELPYTVTALMSQIDLGDEFYAYG